MKPISQNRNPRSVFRLDPPSCALPPKKVLALDPELFQPRSSSTSITRCQPHPSSTTKHTVPSPISSHPSTLLKTHSHQHPTPPYGGFLQAVVSKATAADSDEATNLSSAVASDTTLGLVEHNRAILAQRTADIPSAFSFHSLRNRCFAPREALRKLCRSCALIGSDSDQGSSHGFYDPCIILAVCAQRHAVLCIDAWCSYESPVH